jgi:hypothetical protein
MYALSDTGFRRQKLASRLTLLLVPLLIVSGVAFMSSVPAISQSPPTYRLGFWMQDSSSFPAPQTFFNAMFLTPPYPSTLEMMIFAPLQDQINGYNPASANSYTAKSISYWGQVAKMADSYPNIRLIFDVAFDSTSATYGLANYRTIVTALAQYPSVYGLGVEGEYTTQSSSVYASAYSYVSAAGKLFINYYSGPGVIPSGGYDITHTNFPEGGTGSYDQVGSLQNVDSQTIGIDSGYYGNFRFPSAVTCPINDNAINSATAGWNQCVVSTELSTAVNFSPASARQFLEIDAGFSSSGSFTGVSGLTTNQLWDNPTLRNWIWTDTSYKGNFVLSTGAAAGPGSTTTTSTSSVTTASATSTFTTSSSSTTTFVSSSTTTGSPLQSASYSLATFVKCPAGIPYCGTASPIGVGHYSGGSSVTLRANPNGGYALGSWIICASTCQTYTGNPMTITLSADTKATAVFVSLQ